MVLLIPGVELVGDFGIRNHPLMTHFIIRTKRDQALVVLGPQAVAQGAARAGGGGATEVDADREAEEVVFVGGARLR